MEAEEEGAKKLSEVNFENLPPNYHNESNTETRIGNKTVQTHQEIDKVWENMYRKLLVLTHLFFRNKNTFACFGEK